LPERCFPAVFLVAIDGLRVGKIGEYPLGGLRDDVFGFFHGAS
jgi:hypothetical protein